MATRLDRLFLLLDQGSSQVTRKAAASELGEVQRLHPHELNNLLTKVRQLLHSSSWDTRVAAGQAVEAIVSNVGQWFPSGSSSDASSSPAVDAGRMTFACFDINCIIDRGKDLLASEGNEFDDRSSGWEAECGKDRVIEQRRLLNSRLGLGLGSEVCALSSEDLVSNEDLVVRHQNREDGNRKRQVNDLTKPLSKKVRREDGSTEVADKIVDLSSLEDWPLDWFADELMNDLFSPSWEVRHGAATGLREIVKLQGRCAGRLATAAPDQMDKLNQGERRVPAAVQSFLNLLSLTCSLAGGLSSSPLVRPCTRQVRRLCLRSSGRSCQGNLCPSLGIHLPHHVCRQREQVCCNGDPVA